MTCAQTNPAILTRQPRAGLFVRLLAKWRRADTRWRQRQALAALDDRLLDDIGLTRAQAEREAHKRFWEV